MLANQCHFITNGLFILTSRETVTHRGVDYEWFWLKAAAARVSVRWVTWFEWFAKWYCWMRHSKGSSCEKYRAISSYQRKCSDSTHTRTQTYAAQNTTSFFCILKCRLTFIFVHSAVYTSSENRKHITSFVAECYCMNNHMQS